MTKKRTIHGEVLLVIGTFLAAMGVVLMLYSGAGISAVSSVGYSLSVVFPILTQGTWTYLFQGLLVVILFIVGKRINLSYLFSFVVGFVFGLAIDLHRMWVYALPMNIPLRILYFVSGYLSIAFAVALLNRCLLPIIPTDLFSREFSKLMGVQFTKVKITLDVVCLCFSAALMLVFLKRIEGIGIGTVISALTLGRTISLIGNVMDRHVQVRLLFRRFAK